MTVVAASPIEPALPRGRFAWRLVLRSLWSDPRVGFIVAVGLAAAVALFAAWLTPRGPITAPQALGSIAVALVVGIGAGLVTGSRWTMLLTPMAFMAVFEVARLNVDGPTVDGIRLGSTYGLLAFALGRGLHGVLVLVPLALGARYGVEAASRLGREATPRLRFGWLPTGGVTVAVAVLAIAIAIPATTAPIFAADGRPVAGSVAELATIDIGGHDQTVMIRGRSDGNPVILYLAGGPGGTDLGAMRADVGLEQDFVVATWDQRGVGKSYGALDPAETLTVDRAVADTLELTDYLRERFAEDRIYLVGNSWGTILGVLAARQSPERFHAFVGTGQMVSPVATDTMFYEDTLAWAGRTGNADLVAKLRANGPPPYDDLLAYETALSYEHDWNPYPELDAGRELPFNLFVPENSLMDRLNGLRSFLDTFSVLYPQLQDLDFRRDATALEVPVYMVLGAHEARGRAGPANEWFDVLRAPSKERIIFEHSGHRPPFEQPSTFAALMRRVAVETHGR
jgi:proline iminopeptidase